MWLTSNDEETENWLRMTGFRIFSKNDRLKQMILARILINRF